MCNPLSKTTHFRKYKYFQCTDFARAKRGRLALMIGIRLSWRRGSRARTTGKLCAGAKLDA